MAAAVAGQGVMTFPFTFGVGLIAPPESLPLFWAIDLAAIISIVLLLKYKKHRLAIVPPIIHAALYFSYITFGDAYLGWVA